MLTNPDPYAHVTCPRCGIDHRDYQRARRWVMCADCKPYGPGWAERARREVEQLNKRPKPPSDAFRCGHPKNDANTYRRPDGRSPECLTCKRSKRRPRQAAS